MKSQEFARAIVADLRSRQMSPETINEYARCAAIVHEDVSFDFRRYGIKHLSRHARRPGPKRDLKRDKRMRDAILWVRFNRGSLGVDKAIELAVTEFGLTENALRHAYEGRVKKFRKL